MFLGHREVVEGPLRVWGKLCHRKCLLDEWIAWMASGAVGVLLC